MPQTATLVIETDFLPKGAYIGATPSIIDGALGQALLIAVPRIQEYGVPMLQDQTPRGPDAWHHVGGQSGGGLVGATTSFSDMATAAFEGTEVITISFAQPSENSRGAYYAPWVIFGHNTRNQVSYVGPRPYPETFLTEMETFGVVQAVLLQAAQTVSDAAMGYWAQEAAA